MSPSVVRSVPPVRSPTIAKDLLSPTRQCNFEIVCHNVQGKRSQKTASVTSPFAPLWFQSYPLPISLHDIITNWTSHDPMCHPSRRGIAKCTPVRCYQPYRSSANLDTSCGKCPALYVCQQPVLQKYISFAAKRGASSGSDGSPEAW